MCEGKKEPSCSGFLMALKSEGVLTGCSKRVTDYS